MTVRIYEPFDYLINKKGRNSAENRLNYAFSYLGVDSDKRFLLTN